MESDLGDFLTEDALVEAMRIRRNPGGLDATLLSKNRKKEEEKQLREKKRREKEEKEKEKAASSLVEGGRREGEKGKVGTESSCSRESKGVEKVAEEKMEEESEKDELVEEEEQNVWQLLEKY